MRLIKYLSENDMVLLSALLVVPMVTAVFACKADNYFTQKEVESKIKSFNSGHPLICSQTAFDTKYLISKEKGWHLLGNNVTNGEIVYKLEECNKGE